MHAIFKGVRLKSGLEVLVQEGQPLLIDEGRLYLKGAA